MTDFPAGEELTVIRSEERLLASTRAVPVQRVVLRKVIVSEERTITVTVRHEEFRLDYEPADRTPLDVDPVAMPLELVLREEQLRLVATVVPVERIRVDVRQVTTAQAVTAAVQHEQVDVVGIPQSPNDGGALPRHRS